MDFTTIKTAINEFTTLVNEFVAIMTAFINSFKKDWSFGDDDSADDNAAG